MHRAKTPHLRTNIGATRTLSLSFKNISSTRSSSKPCAGDGRKGDVVWCDAFVSEEQGERRGRSVSSNRRLCAMFTTLCYTMCLLPATVAVMTSQMLSTTQDEFHRSFVFQCVS